MSAGWTTTLNRLALAGALLLFAALLVAWWRDRTRAVETPRWNAREFAPLAGAADRVGPRWLVAVNPDCPHCRARLAELARRGAAAAEHAALGVLVVDTERRPDSLALSSRLTAGVWWDSASVWRKRWGRRVYGEALVFDRDGRLVRVVPPNAEVAGTQ